MYEFKGKGTYFTTSELRKMEYKNRGFCITFINLVNIKKGGYGYKKCKDGKFFLWRKEMLQ
jgi:hypothetical protein